MTQINKFTIIILILILSAIYTFPNIMGEDNAIIINNDKFIINEKEINELNSILKTNNINYKSIFTNDKKELVITFKNTTDQLTCFEILNEKIKGKNINNTLQIIQQEKYEYLKTIGANPMKLGLDLRGGIHLTTKINTQKYIKNTLKTTQKEIKKKLKENKINFINIKNKKNKYITISYISKADYEFIKNLIETQFKDLEIYSHLEKKIKINIKKNKKSDTKNIVINQTIKILSNRINELGISDSVIQKKGKNNIAIELPGIQDIEKAKEILGKTATLKFMLVDTKKNINNTIKTKNESKSKTFYTKAGIPVLLKNKTILDGKSIIAAHSGIDSQFNTPCLNIKINNNEVSNFEKVTMKNIGKQMAIIYKEAYLEKSSDEKLTKEKSIEKIISIATIMSPLSNNFQITGLTAQESKNLALLLRSGSLPTTISIVEEKIIGPTLGIKNAKNGMLSINISLLIILFFMLIYYKRLGFIANIALITNLLLLISILSTIGFVLTMSGIAGIILTIGMSIDANILIFERIKEEIKAGKNQKESIENGFKNAYSSIIDSNITTLIIGIVLFIFSESIVKGFAITLSIGILTSMYSSIFVTKTIIDSLKNKIKLI